MFNRVRYSNRIAAAAVGLVTTVASLGVAETYTMSATACVEADGDINYTAGNAENPNTTDDAIFRCPLFRREADENAITGLYVSVNDQHTGEGIECYARSCDAFGDSCSNSSPEGFSGNSDTGNDDLPLGSVDGDLDGYAYIICTVPDVQGTASPSRVYAYRWDD